ncbi:hypothetical protein BJ508DRAFT_338570 [Ascobolus immersus RN42]|uniref:Uncharacterized protein n=1 Tax=Ascobolus immersus RN42 TaxID=1160509 RepID=A0A3N4HPC2_ASCIM|nr:hypothetical protein BJ508DRAFT_338570 [Ascobolus immersus RN42]
MAKPTEENVWINDPVPRLPPPKPHAIALLPRPKGLSYVSSYRPTYYSQIYRRNYIDPHQNQRFKDAFYRYFAHHDGSAFRYHRMVGFYRNGKAYALGRHDLIIDDLEAEGVLVGGKFYESGKSPEFIVLHRPPTKWYETWSDRIFGTQETCNKLLRDGYVEGPDLIDGMHRTKVIKTSLEIVDQWDDKGMDKPDSTECNLKSIHGYDSESVNLFSHWIVVKVNLKYWYSNKALTNTEHLLNLILIKTISAPAPAKLPWPPVQAMGNAKPRTTNWDITDPLYRPIEPTKHIIKSLLRPEALPLTTTDPEPHFRYSNILRHNYTQPRTNQHLKTAFYRSFADSLTDKVFDYDRIVGYYRNGKAYAWGMQEKMIDHLNAEGVLVRPLGDGCHDHSKKYPAFIVLHRRCSVDLVGGYMLIVTVSRTAKEMV